MKKDVEMKKFLFGLLITWGCVILYFYFPQCLKAKPQNNISQPSTSSAALPSTLLGTGGTGSRPIVFEMKYRGLNGGKDELRYNSYWGFGNPGKDESQFIKELKKNIKELQMEYNPNFKNAEWTAVELKDGKAVAFYFDLNADGRVSDDEKILPSSKEEVKMARSLPDGKMEDIKAERVEFVTPDFIINTADSRQVPFRVLLQGTFGRGIKNCMWSPSCVLEGTSTIDGQPAMLILFADGFSGSFTGFGGSSYYLQTGKEKIGQDVARQTLSGLINHESRFYHLKLNGSHEEGKTIQAVLEKYTGLIGELAVKLVSDANLTSKLDSASISGSKDKTVYFSISAGQSRLPTQAYKLNFATVRYGANNDNNWRVDVREGPEFQIDANSTCTVELCKPAISISAIDEKKRYDSKAKEQTDFSKGTRIYITPQFKGKAGESYGRFAKQGAANRYSDVEPAIRIVDSDGKEVASAKMKYG
jgi:hypothetical protein